MRCTVGHSIELRYLYISEEFVLSVSKHYLSCFPVFSNLRMDSLAQILTQANVRSTAKFMVVESCSGLVIGSVLERLAGNVLVVERKVEYF